MSFHKRTLAAIVSVAALALIAVVSQPLLSGGDPSVARTTDSRDSFPSPQTTAGDTGPKIAPAEDKFVVHEWGTFTTFSGSDGVYLDFRPLAEEHSDLPRFVLDRGSYSETAWIRKSRLYARVRMETPVTYFYTDRFRSVDVRVDFPNGLLTEFYPPTKTILPPLDEKIAYTKGEPIGDSSLDWGTVHLIPQSELLTGVDDEKLRAQIAGQIVRASVPHAENDRHYAHAREVDAALVHVRSERTFPFASASDQRDHLEKFLFYRGVGRFDLPVEVAFRSGTAFFQNNGERPVHSVIAIENRDRTWHAAKFDRVSSGESVSVSQLKAIGHGDLRRMVIDALVGEGLYEKEAVAMVNTWDDSWFLEPGRRVLYMVPAPITEQLLPLHIQPEPQQRVRVLVGRMEIMSPEDEARLTKLVEQSLTARNAFEAEHDPKKKGGPKFAVPNEIKQWGRMTEPALVRIAKIASSTPVGEEAQRLLESLRSE